MLVGKQRSYGALYSYCNVEMPAKDRHASCIQHRKCSRKKPCKHDRHEPVSYWDDVERLLKLAGLRSPRSSSRSQDNQSSGKSFKPAIQMPAPSSLFGNQSKPHAFRSVSKDINEADHVLSIPTIQGNDRGLENLASLGHQISKSSHETTDILTIQNSVSVVNIEAGDDRALRVRHHQVSLDSKSVVSGTNSVR